MLAPTTLVEVEKPLVCLQTDRNPTACTQAGKGMDPFAAQGSSELWQAKVLRHLQMPKRSIRKRGRKHAKESQGGSYEERDVIPFLTPARVPPARAMGPQKTGERLQPNPLGHAVGLTTYLSKAPWGMTEGLVGRPLLLAADSQSAPEST
eukprot:3055486-Amphidinium_carterae.2